MKLTLDFVPVFSLAFIRFSIASLIILPFVAKNLKIQKQDIPLLLLSGFIGITIHIATFFYGVKTSTALNAGIIAATAPLFTIVLAHMFLKERISKNIMVGAVIGIFGISIIFAQDLSNNSVSLSPLGDLLLLVSTLSFVIHEIASKKLFVKYNPFTVTFYSFVIGSLGFSPGVLFDLQLNPTWYTHLPLGAFAGIFYGILGSSIGAYLLWEWGLSKMSASRVGFFIYLDPVVATIAAITLVGEIITIPFIIGTIFIFTGLFVAEKRIHILSLHLTFGKK